MRVIGYGHPKQRPPFPTVVIIVTTVVLLLVTVVLFPAAFMVRDPVGLTQWWGYTFCSGASGLACSVWGVRTQSGWGRLTFVASGTVFLCLLIALIVFRLQEG